MARGARPVAGRMAKLIDEHGAELDRIIAGASIDLSQKDGIEFRFEV
jgi:hypothetical protein